MKKKLVGLSLTSIMTVTLLVGCDDFTSGGFTYIPKTSTWDISSIPEDFDWSNFDPSNPPDNWEDYYNSQNSSMSGSDQGSTDVGSQEGDGDNTKEDEVSKKKLVVETLPDKTTYYKYDDFDSTGLVVIEEGYNSDNELVTSKEIHDYILLDGATEIPLTKFTETGTHLISIVKPKCDSASFTCEVSDVIELAKSIHITKEANKLEFKVGEEYSNSGLQVTLNVTYKIDDEDSEQRRAETLLGKYNISILDESNNCIGMSTSTSPAITLEHPGNYTVKVYIFDENNNVQCFDTYLISVTLDDQDIASRILRIEALPSKLNYYQFDHFEPMGLTVEEIDYDSYGNEVQREYINDYVLLDENNNIVDRLSKAGTNRITVSKGDCAPTYFDCNTIAVLNFEQSLEITQNATTTQYYTGEDYSKDGIKLNLHTEYLRDSEQIIDDQEIDNYSITILKDNNIYTSQRNSTISYTFNEKGNYLVALSIIGWENTEVRNAYQINVIDSTVSRRVLEIKSFPTTVNYYRYDNLDLSGLLVEEVGYNEDGIELSRKTATNYKTSLSNGQWLKQNIDQLIEITKSGCESTSFMVHVNDVSNFTQSLQIQQGPTKSVYYEKDYYEEDGLDVHLLTSYIRDGQSVNKDEKVSNYTSSIVDHTQLESGNYDIVINYIGWDDTPLSISYSQSSIALINVHYLTPHIKVAPKAIYYEYGETSKEERLDFSSLVVDQQDIDGYNNVSSTSDPISDYTLKYNDNNMVVNDNDLVRDVGSYSISAYKTYTNNSQTWERSSEPFNYVVNPVTNFNQELNLNGYKDTFKFKTDYLNLRGLLIKMNTSYTRDVPITPIEEIIDLNNCQVYFDDELVTLDDDLNILYEAADGQLRPYTAKAGTSTIKIQTQGWRGLIESSFDVSFIK